MHSARANSASRAEAGEVVFIRVGYVREPRKVSQNRLDERIGYVGVARISGGGRSRFSTVSPPALPKERLLFRKNGLKFFADMRMFAGYSVKALRSRSLCLTPLNVTIIHSLRNNK